jgi:flagellar basal-body rod modification protein FlgD
MTIDAVNGPVTGPVTGTVPGTVTGTAPVAGTPVEFSSGTGSASADKDMFLKLLVAQMKYQDPMNPTDSSEFLSQSAQFTALEKMSTTAEQVTQLVGLQMAFGASSLVGRTVSYPMADGTSVSGAVSSVKFTSTGPILTVDGVDVAFSEVTAVGDGSTDLAALVAPAPVGTLADPPTTTTATTTTSTV